MQPATVQHNLFILPNHVSSFSLSTDVFARSSSNWGRQTDQHALAVLCLCDNMSVTMKPHSAYSPPCVLKASIWVRCTNKAINLSVSLFCLCVCSQIVVECERDRKGKRRSLSFLLGKGISYAYVQVCVRACEQWIWSAAVACGGLLNIQFSFRLHSFLIKDILYKTAFTSHSQVVLFHSL